MNEAMKMKGDEMGRRKERRRLNKTQMVGAQESLFP